MANNLLIRLTLLLLILNLAACSVTSPTPTALPSTATAANSPQLTVAQITTQTSALIPTEQPTIQTTILTAQLQPIAGSYLFAEGPAADVRGNVYFSDINAGKIYRWSADGQVSIFIEDLERPNGLEFDQNGLLVACEGGSGRLIAIDQQANITVLADQYDGVRFNEPNDLWIDPKGGIYFTDPAFNAPVVQESEAVYYLSPDRSQVIRVEADMVRPNGIVGTQDGQTLYVADYGAGKTFAYAINADGTLSGKRLFTASGSDGMELDAQGNLYLTTPHAVQVFDPAGNQFSQIAVPEDPTNVTFVGDDDQILFITARTGVYTLANPPAIAVIENNPAESPNSDDFNLNSPDIAADGLLPAEYTCDGAANTLALEWSGAPESTVGYAIIMHHEAGPDDIHWYWVIYNISADVTSLPQNMTGIGTLGNNSVNGKTAYTPPCSKGPGAKTYTYTVYALSAQPQLSVPAEQVNRAVLLEAIREITLAIAELNVSYARP